MKDKSIGLSSGFDCCGENKENESSLTGCQSLGSEVGASEKVKKERKPAKKRVKSKKGAVAEKLRPLRVAAENIADMLSALSEDEELFVVSQDEKPPRRIDTKTLKEFSSVIKEITGVICELNGISTAGGGEAAGAVKIEFDEEAAACSQ